MSDCGGDCSHVEDQLKDVERIVGNLGAFCAIRSDGSVVTWGEAQCGADSRAVEELLKDVKDVQGTDFSFAAILADRLLEQGLTVSCLIVSFSRINSLGGSSGSCHRLVPVRFRFCS